MLRYAITDRYLFHGSEAEQRQALRDQARAAGRARIDFLQLREKDIGEGELLLLACDLRASLPQNNPPRLLLNGPAKMAVAARSDGLHVPGGWDVADLLQARAAFHDAGLPPPILSVTAHSLEEVRAAKQGGADLILFGPVFEKRVRGVLLYAGVGLAALTEAVREAGSTPVLALGGVTATNARLCVAAGTAGVAGIRLFLRPVPFPETTRSS